MAATYTSGGTDPQAMQAAQDLVNADNGFGVKAATTSPPIVPPPEKVTKADLAPPPVTVPPPENVTRADLAPPPPAAVASNAAVAVPPPPPVQQKERSWVNMAGSASDTGSLWVPDMTPHHHAAPAVAPPAAAAATEPPLVAATAREQVVKADLPPPPPPAPAEQSVTLQQMEKALKQVQRAEHRYSQGLKHHHSKVQEVDVTLGSRKIAITAGKVGGEMGVNLSEVEPDGISHRSYRQALGADGKTALADFEKDLKAGIAATKKEQKAPAKQSRRATPVSDSPSALA